MSQRIALFASQEEIERTTGLQFPRESLFHPRYNIAPGQLVDIICEQENEPVLDRARWGLGDEQKEITVIDEKKALEGLGQGEYSTCIVPVSGYYKWKNNGKRAEYPFFIRMLNEPVMILGAVMMEAAPGEETGLKRCAIIQSESNALVQPLDPEMPLQLDRDLTPKWLDSDVDPSVIVENARQLFLMTDMTVLRVSDKVNDLSENSPELIQPLPK